VVYCAGISVLPEYQSKGVGSKLIKWGTDYADENDASMWIHLADTEAGPKAFEKAGFKVATTLRINLDEWTVVEEKGKWGVYTFRYMRRPAKGEVGN
jgi:GNAT superfamily N-acetyltransferase